MSLQKEAEDWVKYLAENNKFHHSKKNPGNLYLSHPNDYPPEYCSDAVQWFHSEEKFYNYEKPGYVGKAGHFTQVNEDRTVNTVGLPNATTFESLFRKHS